MKKSSLLIAAMLSSVLLLAALQLINKRVHGVAGDTNVDSSKYERDILPEILALNNEVRNLPPKGFRTGHVKSKKLKDYTEKTEDGFVITFPSGTSLPTPALVNNTIFLSGGFGSKDYYAFDANTGETKWTIGLDDDGPSSPAISDGIIVFNTESCTIFACDLITGKKVWSYWLGDPLMSMPTIANGMVFTSYPAFFPGDLVSGPDSTNRNPLLRPTHVLAAFELKTGKILWQKWIDSDIMSAPVAKDDMLYITTFAGGLYKIKQQTGDIVEAKMIRATSAPVFRGNEVIVSRRGDKDGDSFASEEVVIGYGTANKKVSDKKKAFYLDSSVQSKGALKNQSMHLDAGNGFAAGAPANSNWQAAYFNIGQSNVYSLQSFQGSRGLYRNDRLYNTMGDEITCIDMEGKTIWKYKLDGDIKKEGGFMGTPPIYANGNIIVATFTGEVLIIDESKGTVTKKYKINDPVRYQPVVDNGWIYVTTINSKLYAINTGDPAITGWNMWGGNAARTNM